jgi:hypothetical protein
MGLSLIKSDKRKTRLQMRLPLVNERLGFFGWLVVRGD